jgi:type IV pilus assembly protein PilC
MAIVTSEKDSPARQTTASGVELEVVLRFLRQLQVKLKAGLSIEKGLAALVSETGNRRMRKACAAMRNEVAKGIPLAQAMRGQGLLFDACVISLVERGERSGKLKAALTSAAQYVESSARQRRALHNAVARPLNALSLVLLAVFVAAVVLSFLVKEVLPGADGAALTGATAVDRIALVVSEVMRRVWPYVGVFGFLCFLALRLLPRYPQTRAWLDRLALELPLVGAASRSAALAVLHCTVGIRMQAGDTLAQAMAIAAATAHNLSMRTAIAATIRKIEEGKPYIEALVEDGFFRMGDVTAVQAAERRGEIAALMLTLARDREREAAADVRTLKTVSHMLVVVLIGVAIVGVMVSLYVPVFVLR